MPVIASGAAAPVGAAVADRAAVRRGVPGVRVPHACHGAPRQWHRRHRAGVDLQPGRRRLLVLLHPQRLRSHLVAASDRHRSSVLAAASRPDLPQPRRDLAGGPRHRPARRRAQRSRRPAEPVAGAGLVTRPAGLLRHERRGLVTGLRGLLLRAVSTAAPRPVAAARARAVVGRGRQHDRDLAGAARYAAARHAVPVLGDLGVPGGAPARVRQWNAARPDRPGGPLARIRRCLARHGADRRSVRRVPMVAPGAAPGRQHGGTAGVAHRGDRRRRRVRPPDPVELAVAALAGSALLRLLPGPPSGAARRRTAGRQLALRLHRGGAGRRRAGARVVRKLAAVPLCRAAGQAPPGASTGWLAKDIGVSRRTCARSRCVQSGPGG